MKALNLTKTYFAPVAIALMISGFAAVQAQSITGSIQFVGGATLNGPIATATAYTAFFGPGGTGTLPQVLGGSQSGDYAGVPTGTLTTITPFSFNPSGAPVMPLWTFTVGATTYSFDATSITVDFQSSAFLNIEGTGVAHITGFSDTPGTWSFTDTGLGATPVFTFGGATTVVPEPSVTELAMMAAPLLGFAWAGAKRKIARA